MLISTKGRYALRVIIDLAENSHGEYIPLKDIVDRQEISPKYMERIMVTLVKNNIVEGVHGKGGGYRLTKDPSEYSVGEILRITEGSISPIACLDSQNNICPRSETCRTLPMWKKLDNIVNEYLDNVSILDLMKTE